MTPYEERLYNWLAPRSCKILSVDDGDNLMTFPDIGNLHVIDYYLHHAMGQLNNLPWHKPMPATRARYKLDFDIETEQREGWTYEND